MRVSRALVAAAVTTGIGIAGCSNDSGGVVNTPPGCSGAEIHDEPAFAGAPPTGEALVAAMGGPSASEAPVVYGHGDAYAVFGELGTMEPTQGSSFAWLSTGIAGAGTPSSAVEGANDPQFGTDNDVAGCAGADTFDCVRLVYSFVVPEGHQTVRFDFQFISTEYPEFINAQYNDTFRVSLDSPSFSFPNVSFDAEGNPINIDNALFEDTDCDEFEGTGFDLLDELGGCDAGATGLLGTIAPVAPGETVTLEFALYDDGDAIYDSAVMIDNVETTPAVVEAPQTSDCD